MLTMTPAIRITALLALGLLATHVSGQELNPQDLPRTKLELTLGEFSEGRENRPKTLPVLDANPRNAEVASSTDVFNQWLMKIWRTAPGGVHEFVFQPDGDGHYFALKGHNRILSVWRGGGFEIIPQAFVVLNSSKEKLRVETVLDHALLASIGTVKIEEIHDLTSTRRIIIGRMQGGDGEESWGAVWVAAWEEPRKFQLLHQFDYTSPWNLERRIDYKLDPAALSLTFSQKARTRDSGNLPTPPKPPGPWKEERHWTISLAGKDK